RRRPFEPGGLQSAALAILVLTINATFVAAATDAGTDAPHIHRLFIPMDSEGNPAGDKYYVSERFLEDLNRVNNRPLDLHHWLLHGAEIHGALRQASDGDIVADEWRLTFSIEVLSRDATV